MDKLENVIKGLACCTNAPFAQCDDCPYRHGGKPPKYGCETELEMDALKLLKAQEQEINRLKYHIDCDAAEKLPSGCVGYGRGFNDDEPCETCKQCPAYNGYGEE